MFCKIVLPSQACGLHQKEICAGGSTVDSRKKVTLLPVPWGVFSLFYAGRFLAHEVMTKEKFLDTMNDILKRNSR